MRRTRGTSGEIGRSDAPAARDVVVLTSRNEGTPVALIEAGVAGKPAVATRVGGVADVVQDGKTGLLVQPGDPRAVAAGISALLDDPGRARALGEAAKRETSSRFTIERLADDLAGLYGELLARKGCPTAGCPRRSAAGPSRCLDPRKRSGTREMSRPRVSVGPRCAREI